MSDRTMNRRAFVSGSTSMAAVGVTASLFATGAVKAMPPAIKSAKGSTHVVGGTNGPIDLAKYHCSLVHKAMSDKLTRIVADPNVSSSKTAHALKTTFCPCCQTQITAAFPVVPWREIGKAYG